ncbi:MAG TPA: HYR domain-containing protein [Thermoanaerobaculia bacterium]|nr:HYR domain-containing protein [Thermoanaerobaculia bacterium]
MRRAIGVALLFLLSLPAVAGTITGISPTSIQVLSGEHFMEASGYGFSDTDEFIFDGPTGRLTVSVNSIDLKGNITGWVPLPVVNKPGSYTLTVRSRDGDSEPFPFTVYKPSGRLPLQIHLPELIAVIARGRLGTGIKYDVSTSGGDGSLVTIKCDPASGSTFPVGTSQIYCMAYNAEERDETKAQVNVWDGVPPKVTVPASFEVAADDERGAFVKFDVSAIDDIDDGARVLCDRDSGSFFPNGNTKVTCEATDSSLNVGYGAFTVFVKPRDPGVLKLDAPDIRVEATGGEGAYVEYKVTAYGSADPDPVVECFPESGTWFWIGDHKASCTATDDFGARAEAYFVVSVLKEGSFLRGEDINAEATSPSGAEVSWKLDVPAGWKGAVDCLPAAGSLFAFGETSVECSSTTDDGEKVAGKFKVTVADTTAPHIEDIRATVGELDAERAIVPVNVEVQTVDAADVSPRCSVSALNADVKADWRATSDLGLEIRAGAGMPRAFRVQVTCVDASGNSTETSVPLAISKGRPVAKVDE